MRGRGDLVDWYRRNRRQSRALFDLLDPAAYYSRPIALRNPIVFYEGHLPAFSLISLVKRGLGRPGVENAERLEQLFARGIDPESEAAAVPRSGASTVWPSRDEVIAFGERADALVVDALLHGAFDLEGRVHPAMKRGEAIYTALEHEAMHQETLLYMWHRLPHAQKQKPADLTYELDGCTADRTTRDDPRRHGHARRRPRRACRSAGTTSSTRTRCTSRRSRLTSHSVTNADFLAFVEAGGYQDRSLWSDEGWAWVQQDGVEHPAFWSTRATSARSGQGMALARDVREPAAAAGLAGLREPGRSLRVCPLERAPAADGGRVSPRRVRHARRRRAPIPVGRRGAGSEPRQLRFRRLGAGAGGLAARGRQRLGRARSRRQRLGVDVDGLRAVRRVCADAVLSGILRRLLRRPALRDEGRLSGHGAGAHPARASGTGSAPTIRTSTRSSGRHGVPRDADHRPRSRPALRATSRAICSSTPKQLQSKYLYDALGSSLFDAICRLPWYRITRAERRLLERHAADDRRARRVRRAQSQARPTIVELGCGSGEKLALLAEALQARGGSARVHLIDISSQALEQTEQRLTRWQHFSVVGHQSTYEEGLRRAAAARDAGSPVLVLFLGSNIGNFDTPAAGAFLRRIRRALEPGDLLLLGADLVKPEPRAAARLRRPARRDRRVQQEPARPHQPRAAGGLRPRRRSSIARSGTARAADRDAPGQPAPNRRCESPPRGVRSDVRQGRMDLDRELLQVLRRPDRGHGHRRRLRPRRAVARRTARVLR